MDPQETRMPTCTKSLSGTSRGKYDQLLYSAIVSAFTCGAVFSFSHMVELVREEANLRHQALGPCSERFILHALQKLAAKSWVKISYRRVGDANCTRIVTILDKGRTGLIEAASKRLHMPERGTRCKKQLLEEHVILARELYEIRCRLSTAANGLVCPDLPLSKKISGNYAIQEVDEQLTEIVDLMNWYRAEIERQKEEIKYADERLTNLRRLWW